MTITTMKTKAEEQLAEQFARTAPLLPGGAWVPAARRAAFQAFAANGLPHRRIEAWKYTDLRAGLKEAFSPAQCSTRTFDAAALATVLGPDLAQLPCIRVVIVNGRWQAKMIPAGQEPGATYHMGSLAAVLGQPDYDWMELCFGVSTISDADTLGGGAVVDPVMALNSAFASDGVVLSIVEGARLGLPIHIVSIVDADAPMATATRCLIKVGAGAKAEIIESHVRLGESPAQATAVTQISLEAGAEAHHVQHLAANGSSAHLGRWDVELAERAIYRGFQFTAGGGLVRNETHVSFTGPDAKFDFSGAFLGRDRDHIDTTLVVDHSTTGCESRELFKGVLDGHARGIFQGKVIVQPVAQKTDGKQMAQVLMLSEDAEFDSKPELEIYADDVACGHGSTAAEIDGDMMFYLRSRGIPEDQARALLIESFVGEAIDKIQSEAIRTSVMNIALAWLRDLPAQAAPLKAAKAATPNKARE